MLCDDGKPPGDLLLVMIINTFKIHQILTKKGDVRVEFWELVRSCWGFYLFIYLFIPPPSGVKLYLTLARSFRAGARLRARRKWTKAVP